MQEKHRPATGKVRLFGQGQSNDAYQIRDLLTRSVVAFDWIELASDAACMRELGSTLADARLPVAELPDGGRMSAPSLRELAERLGWVTQPKLHEHDLSIYGAGSAGLSAAVYAASEGLRAIIIERHAVGGQAGSSSMIENYMGFPQGIAGAELAERARQQAVKFGVELVSRLCSPLPGRDRPKDFVPTARERGNTDVNPRPDVLQMRFPARRILDLIGDKWTLAVLFCISLREVRRFNELQRQIPDISKKMLIQNLRNLERDGLVDRTVYQQVPPKTEYRLTKDGRRLREPISQLCEWAIESEDFVATLFARRQADPGVRKSCRPCEKAGVRPFAMCVSRVLMDFNYRGLESRP